MRFDLLVPLAVAFAASGCGSSSNSDNPVVDTNKSPDGGGSNDATAPDASGSDGATSVPTATAYATVPLDSCDEATSYAANLTIGGQSFEVIIDTGSTTLGVAGESAPDSGTGCCGSTSPIYEPGSSATDEHVTSNEQFGTGNFQGEVYQDSVGFSSASDVPLKFISITSQSNDPSAGQPPVVGNQTCGHSTQVGLMGFDVAGAAAPNTQAYFDQLVAGKNIPNSFAIELCDTGGTLWLGGYDSSATTAAPQYTNFLTQSFDSLYYAVDLESIDVAGVTTPVAVATSQYQASVLDTGTSIFLLGTTAFNSLTTAIASSSGFQQATSNAGASFFQPTSDGSLNCISGTKAQLDSALPALTLNFGTNPTISVKAAPTESYLTYTSQGGQTGWCASIISQAQSANEFPFASIFGAPMLKSNVVIFDRANGRAGFAPHTPCPGASSEIVRDTSLKAKVRRPRFPAQR